MWEVSSDFNLGNEPENESIILVAVLQNWFSPFTMVLLWALTQAFIPMPQRNRNF